MELRGATIALAAMKIAPMAGTRRDQPAGEIDCIARGIA